MVDSILLYYFGHLGTIPTQVYKQPYQPNHTTYHTNHDALRHSMLHCVILIGCRPPAVVPGLPRVVAGFGWWKFFPKKHNPNRSKKQRNRP